MGDIRGRMRTRSKAFLSRRLRQDSGPALAKLASGWPFRPALGAGSAPDGSRCVEMSKTGRRDRARRDSTPTTRRGTTSHCERGDSAVNVGSGSARAVGVPTALGEAVRKLLLHDLIHSINPGTCAANGMVTLGPPLRSPKAATVVPEDDTPAAQHNHNIPTLGATVAALGDRVDCHIPLTHISRRSPCQVFTPSSPPCPVGRRLRLRGRGRSRGGIAGSRRGGRWRCRPRVTRPRRGCAARGRDRAHRHQALLKEQRIGHRHPLVKPSSSMPGVMLQYERGSATKNIGTM